MWSASDTRGKYEYADLNHDTKADQKTDQDRCEHGGSKVRLVIRQQSVHRLVWPVLPRCSSSIALTIARHTASPLIEELIGAASSQHD
jgi:hypothetical protein